MCYYSDNRAALLLLEFSGSNGQLLATS